MFLVIVSAGALGAACSSSQPTCSANECADAGSGDLALPPDLVTGPGDLARSCTITLSGALTGTFACTRTVSWSSSSNLGAVTLMVPSPTPLESISVSVARPNEPSSGVWQNSDIGAKVDLVVVNAGPPRSSWSCSYGSSADRGQYTMTLQNLGPIATTANGKSYDASGSLDAALPADSVTGASGTTALHATF